MPSEASEDLPGPAPDEAEYSAVRDRDTTAQEPCLGPEISAPSDREPKKSNVKVTRYPSGKLKDEACQPFGVPDFDRLELS